MRQTTLGLHAFESGTEGFEPGNPGPLQHGRGRRCEREVVIGFHVSHGSAPHGPDDAVD